MLFAGCNRSTDGEEQIGPAETGSPVSQPGPAPIGCDRHGMSAQRVVAFAGARVDGCGKRLRHIDASCRKSGRIDIEVATTAMAQAREIKHAVMQFGPEFFALTVDDDAEVLGRAPACDLILRAPDVEVSLELIRNRRR